MRVVSREPRFVVVEGNDDRQLVGAILRELGITNVEIENVGGKYNLRAGLNALRRREPDLAAIGVIRDADDSASSALQSATDALTYAFNAAPASHAELTPRSADAPTALGVFIMPDGKSPGSVEDLCWQAVKDTPAAACAEEYLRCLNDSDALNSKNDAKSLAHAYLAAQESPTQTVGIGAQKGYWPLDHNVFRPLREFLQQLSEA